MLQIEKVISSLLTFPGIFIILWGIVSVYLFYIKSNFFIKLIAVFSLLLMIFMYTALGIQVLVFPLEKYYAQDNFYTIDKYPVVVLGGGINYGVPKKEAELSVHSLERLVRGYELQDKLNSDILYSGGVAVSKSGVSEADIAKKWLNEMGVDSENIIKEDKARTTYENGIYVKEWMENNEVKDIYLVTSAIHMPRAGAVFSKLNINFTPVISGYSYNHNLSWLDYLPSRGALTANLAATHEWLGLIWYKVKGRI